MSLEEFTETDQEPSDAAGGGGGSPDWAADIDSSPDEPTLAFEVNEPGMTAAFDPVTVSTLNHLCVDAVGRDSNAFAAKIGFGDDSFSHNCAIVERTVNGEDLRYVAVGLGSAPNRKRVDLSDLFVLLDEAAVTGNA
jgi:hypothetical protein